jgi:N-carbamoyl-L-amino-acid hydrolase
MLADAERAAETAAGGRGCELALSPLWRIEPIPFDPGLVAIVREACREVAGEPAELPSGALHDAAEVARVMPAAMLFAPSTTGISHAPEEDTDEADLIVAIEAYGHAARLICRRS